MALTPSAPALPSLVGSGRKYNPMITLLKLTLAPTLVAGASLAGRRWGPTVGGWIAGFPIVAGPVLFFYALEQGPAFAAGAAHATLMGLLSLCVFSLVYGGLAGRSPWMVCLPLGWAAFGLLTAILGGFKLPLWGAFVFGTGALAATLVLLPKPVGELPPVFRSPWDIGIRMAATAGIVLTLTGLAAWLGPALSGLLTPFPVASSVLVVFAHREQGSIAAVRVLRGLIGGLFGFTGFCVVLALTLESWGIGPAFGAALVVASMVQALLLRWMTREGKAPPVRELKLS
jgi:hypothetical protein